jgi:hypothetical protein
MSFLKNFFVFVLFSILIGCIAKPDYPVIPSIEHLTTNNFRTSNSRIDSVSVTIKFKDGDGDLGLKPTDTFPPYQQLLPNGKINPNYYNFDVKIERKTLGNFAELPLDFPLSGRFPYLNTEDRKSALEGTLTYYFNVPFGGFISPIREFDTLRFSVSIKDRALHESNVVKTNEIVIGSYR